MTVDPRRAPARGWSLSSLLWLALVVASAPALAADAADRFHEIHALLVFVRSRRPEDLGRKRIDVAGRPLEHVGGPGDDLVQEPEEDCETAA